MSYGIFFGLLLLLSIAGMLRRYGAGKNHFFGAIGEVFVVWLFSNFPFLFLIFDYALLSSGDQVSWTGSVSVLGANLSGGEVFIYISAILAPVFYVTLFKFKESHRAFGAFYIIIMFVLISASAFLFARHRGGTVVNIEFQNAMASFIYFSALSLWVGSVVYSKALPELIIPESYSSAGKNILKELEGGEDG